MIVDLPDTTTTAVNKKLDELREKTGAVTMGRVLTLIIAPHSEDVLEESLKAANDASHEHPSRIIVTMRGDPYADDARLDAQLRAGGDAGASEVVVLRLLAAQQEAGKVTVRIGHETEAEQMVGTSVVSTTYGTTDTVYGGMGVLGPTRMDYPGTIASVAAVALYIGEVLGAR